MSPGPFLPFCGTFAGGSVVAVGVSCALSTDASEATPAASSADVVSDMHIVPQGVCDSFLNNEPQSNCWNNLF